MSKKTVGILAGSLRRDSISRIIAGFFSELLSVRFDVCILDIAPLAMYNQDLDNGNDIPEEWKRFRAVVKGLDAVLFVTPEYNRSVPAVLKNALDIASRPYGANAWSGKPGAVVSVSPGAIGGFGANHHLRQTAACLNIRMMQQPEAYIGGIGSPADLENSSDFFHKFAEAFAEWIESPYTIFT